MSDYYEKMTAKRELTPADEDMLAELLGRKGAQEETVKRFPEGWTYRDGGYMAGKPMADGRWWCLMPLTLGRLRIVIAEDEWTAGEHWCYDNVAAAWANWDAGPTHTPVGWSRHMLPDGTKEYPRER